MSSERSLRAIVVVALLAVAVTAIGLVAFWPSEAQQEHGPPIGHNASERLASLDGVSATVETVVHYGNQTNRTVQRVWMRPGTGEMRAEVLEGPGPDLTVSNGSVTWLYDHTENNVTRLDTSGSGTQVSMQGERIERLFTRLNVSREARDASKEAEITPSAAPLPSVPGGQSVSTPTPEASRADEYGVHYEGTDTVSGREVYVVTVRPKAVDEDAAVLEDYEQTMYVDTEWFYPLKVHTEWTGDNRSVEMSMTYRNVTFEPGLDDDRFEFEPPENATVVESDLSDVRTFDSVSSLRTATSMPVPTPDVPPSFEFDTGRVTAGTFESVSLEYANETATLTVSVTNQTSDSESDGQRLTVGGREVVYQQFGTSKLVSWECNGRTYSVSGTAVAESRLLDVTASIECR